MRMRARTERMRLLQRVSQWNFSERTNERASERASQRTNERMNQPTSDWDTESQWGRRNEKLERDRLRHWKSECESERERENAVGEKCKCFVEGLLAPIGTLLRQLVPLQLRLQPQPQPPTTLLLSQPIVPLLIIFQSHIFADPQSAWPSLAISGSLARYLSRPKSYLSTRT